MRDEIYGIAVIGFAAGLYGFAALMGLVHATAIGPSSAELRPLIHPQENVKIAMNR